MHAWNDWKCTIFIATSVNPIFGTVESSKIVSYVMTLMCCSVYQFFDLLNMHVVSVNVHALCMHFNRHVNCTAVKSKLICNRHVTDQLIMQAYFSA